ncbi:MAG: TonB-dependent receptor plug domain-containing protein [Porticoccaceae bacterium]
MPRNRFLAATAGLLFSPLLYSQEGAFITEDDVLGELPSVTSVSRMVQPLSKVPASVTIIDRQMIKASGALTWVDVFRLVPGFESYYINGNRYGISYHGYGREFPNHLEIMVDGRSIYDPVFASIEWGSLGISLDDVDHIEIVRGSNAPAHGSNAFLGAVNIITRKPVQDRGWHVSTTTGEQHTRNSNVRYSGNADKLDYQASFNYEHNEGFPAVRSGEDQGDMEDGKEKLSLDLRTMYTPNISDTFDFQAGFSHSNMGWGDADHPDEYARVNFKNQYQSVKWNRDLNSTDALQVHFYRNKIEGENYVNLGRVSDLLSQELGFTVTPDQVPVFFQTIDPSLNIQDQDYITGFRGVESERYDLEFEHRLQLTETLRATWGSGIRYDNIEGETILGRDDEDSLTSRRLFSHLEWQPSPHWTFNAGLIMENNAVVDTISSGRLAVNYHFNDFHTLRLGYALGKRSPSLAEAKEYNADILDDQILVTAIRRSADNMEEERLRSYEIGYLAQLPDTGLTFDARLYREEVRDGLEVYQEQLDVDIPVLDPNENFSVRDNILRSDVTGVELQLRYQPTERTLINAHYGYRDIDSFYISRFHPGINTNDVNDTSPHHTAGLLLHHQFTENWSSGLSLYHISDARWRDGNAVDQFVRTDLMLGYNFQVGTTAGNLSLIAQNLGDDYEEHARNNVFETRFFLRLTLDFD